MKAGTRMPGFGPGVVRAIALIGAVFLALRGAFAGSFIFDDYALLALPRFLDNPLLPFWHQHVEGGLHYRPLGVLLWWLSERLFGADACPHYLLNAALLSLVVLSLWRLVARLIGDRGTAFAIAFVFAIHPIAIGTTAWLSNRYELLASVLGLLALARAWEYRQTRRTGALLATLLLFALGLCAKENTAALISAAFVFWWWPSAQRPAWLDRRQLACLWLAAVFVAWLLVRHWVLPPTGTEQLFAYKSAWVLFSEGMAAWFLKLPSYLFLWPRLGGVTATLFVLGALGLLLLAWNRSRGAWDRDRVALIVAGLALIAVAALVQWPRTGLVLMNLHFGADTLEDVLAARHYFMSALGMALAMAAVFAGSGPATALHQRWLAGLGTALLVIPLFSVSQHLARSYRGTTLEQARFASAAVAAIGKLDLAVEDCQIYLVDTDSKLFGFYVDTTIKALAPDLSKLGRCFIQTEFSPWYHLVERSEVLRAQKPPFSPVRAGRDTVAPILIGRGALVFLNMAPEAKPPLGPGSYFLAWRDGAFVDVSEEVRTGRRSVRFFCFRAPSECP
ncbi:glycosyltransferase family 39 protein [Dokdonella immobilis]|uniref:4-amino-4-deoxy-L-arabinose transferase n=1 Tax=Dokdonella immobilis TaxID=578942 RepID=A0A1I4XBV2_9GAMM|nr:glycosyltransferase family 39 protein [Dokdonella immobilis]SFN23387.1 4-amino-4-deoxy-L-arabinose transferase [Dokdonella immobilis]